MSRPVSYRRAPLWHNRGEVTQAEIQSTCTVISTGGQLQLGPLFLALDRPERGGLSPPYYLTGGGSILPRFVSSVRLKCGITSTHLPGGGDPTSRPHRHAGRREGAPSRRRGLRRREPCLQARMDPLSTNQGLVRDQAEGERDRERSTGASRPTPLGGLSRTLKRGATGLADPLQGQAQAVALAHAATCPEGVGRSARPIACGSLRAGRTEP